MEAYQESAPTVRGSFNVYRRAGKTWRFHHWIYRGNAYLDDYREFATGGLVWTPDDSTGSGQACDCTRNVTYRPLDARWKLVRIA